MMEFKRYVEKRSEVEARQILTIDDAVELAKESASCDVTLSVAHGVTGDFTLRIYNPKRDEEWVVNRGDYFICSRYLPTPEGSELVPPQVVPCDEFRAQWAEATGQ
ncbi:hypothetical protein SEA_EJIMIX_144 [Mycobacterium phage Ejimix]|uniref:hypothetical protein n=1 Tax=Mycobacterium phage Wanda TaxID=1340713 RepID=UPI000387DFB4|nr:hypothetical protein N857_gp151 [Mycobacterium phage Wanda]YP_009124104.1 hypothetical protein VC71_gp151 [Mycobacterium phage Minerva]AWH13964.1 hypothetical protein SEA_HALLEY_153 [Mycobacterium phage Halley]AXQ52144.1 hypothetical protein SEA_EJIMIX_144 [Mycobacterium phage Ejimix]AXQ62553.1 hypothetical protein SEA_ZELINK_146 [Mycobacterium phage Zelink]QBI97595.1 hypothetical protein SEA_HUGHESYANG_151 [Mycobacterium phage Hughesyang]QBI98772.1 hypothetical protein SEA_BOBBY_142 [Myco